MVCLEFPRSENVDQDMMDAPCQAELQLPSKLENRQVLDFCVLEGAVRPTKDGQAASADGSLVAFLFSENVLVVFDIAARAAVFKAKYADATDSIS